jgi:molybdenum cofactor biosynthesis enzyme MoaA
MNKKTIVFTIHGACNLSCHYCNLTYHKTAITLKSIQEFLKEETPESAYIILSGGEPTLNKEFKEILEWLELKNFDGQVITNGFKILDYLSSFKKFKINLSLSSLNIELFDEKDLITWNVLPKIIKNHPLGSRGITLSPVFKNNFNETKLLLDFAKENKLNLTMNLFTQLSGNDVAYYHKRTPTELLELEKLICYYEEVWTEDWWIRPSTLSKYYRYYSLGKYFRCNPKTQKELDIHVLPEKTGNSYDVSYCCFFDKKTEESMEKCGGCLDVCVLNNYLLWNKDKKVK